MAYLNKLPSTQNGENMRPNTAIDFLLDQIIPHISDWRGIAYY